MTAVCCLLIDEQKMSAFGIAFSVKVSAGVTVETLKDELKRKDSSDLFRNIPSRSFTVWRCLKTKLLSTTNRAQLKRELCNMNFDDETDVRELGIGQIDNGSGSF